RIIEAALTNAPFTRRERPFPSLVASLRSRSSRLVRCADTPASVGILAPALRSFLRHPPPTSETLHFRRQHPNRSDTTSQHGHISPPLAVKGNNPPLRLSLCRIADGTQSAKPRLPRAGPLSRQDSTTQPRNSKPSKPP